MPSFWAIKTDKTMKSHYNCSEGKVTRTGFSSTNCLFHFLQHWWKVCSGSIEFPRSPWFTIYCTFLRPALPLAVICLSVLKTYFLWSSIDLENKPSKLLNKTFQINWKDNQTNIIVFFQANITFIFSTWNVHSIFGSLAGWEGQKKIIQRCTQNLLVQIYRWEGFCGVEAKCWQMGIAHNANLVSWQVGPQPQFPWCVLPWFHD